MPWPYHDVLVFNKYDYIFDAFGIQTPVSILVVYFCPHRDRSARSLAMSAAISGSNMNKHDSDTSSQATAIERGPAVNSFPFSISNADADESISARQERVAQLARTFTGRSIDSIPSHSANPFLPSDPTLDPTSPSFDAKRWASALLHAFSQDPERYPRHTVGVAYRNLSVHGFGSSTDYQKDVLNVLWRGPQILREWLSNRRSKIQILNDFEGLVNKGEMLLVLGRPGRWVIKR